MHSRIKTILYGILKTKKIAGAYLFIGAPGSGKLDAALDFARSAAKIEKENHPDLIIIEKENASLKIGQIRGLKEAVRYGPNQADYLFAIIKNAEAMTPEAANSFLKCMEEPPPQTVFILLTESETALPKTILSRCQKIYFPEKENLEIKPEAEELCGNISGAKNAFDLLDLAKNLDLNEELLDSLTSLYYREQNIKSIRIIQEILQNIKRKGNKKLAADIMLLRLGDIWSRN